MHAFRRNETHTLALQRATVFTARNEDHRQAVQVQTRADRAPDTARPIDYKSHRPTEIGNLLEQPDAPGNHAHSPPEQIGAQISDHPRGRFV